MSQRSQLARMIHLPISVIPEFSCVEVLKLGDYDLHIYLYLAIQQRVGYFYERLV